MKTNGMYVRIVVYTRTGNAVQESREATIPVRKDGTVPRLQVMAAVASAIEQCIKQRDEYLRKVGS